MAGQSSVALWPAQPALMLPSPPSIQYANINLPNATVSKQVVPGAGQGGMSKPPHCRVKRPGQSRSELSPSLDSPDLVQASQPPGYSVVVDQGLAEGSGSVADEDEAGLPEAESLGLVPPEADEDALALELGVGLSHRHKANEQKVSQPA